jgi:hypothetical protein
MLVSGPAAAGVADAINRLGGNAEVLAGPAGAAATRKLVRSVFYKGLAAAVVESLRAGRAAGCESWLRDNIAAELAAAARPRWSASRRAAAVTPCAGPTRWPPPPPCSASSACRPGLRPPARTGWPSWPRREAIFHDHDDFSG